MELQFRSTDFKIPRLYCILL
ncbi:hypothetical protein Godav_004950 [Gossypium davidsonii]|uniref:Uncharacterized protein n=1 Tax=Gossypium davidsonii TaxID=34287 RepID=A0A7J8SPA6_GOSDV|nr:hypothetical protein [Gossypium davidsonii]